MKLNHHFNKLHSEISLNKDRRDRIDSAISNLEDFIKSNDEISDCLLDNFVQGSIAINTAIKPKDENIEFDVDIVLVLDINKLEFDNQTPQGVISWLADRLRENSPHYDGKVRQKNRCVRINYAGEFHLDIVPAKYSGQSNQSIYVPNKEEECWELSNPQGFRDWALLIDGNSNKKFHRIMKMLKHWRDYKFGNDSRPSSIMLTTLIGDHMQYDCSADSDALVLTMENLSNFIKPLPSPPIVNNPSLSSENLARDWDQDHFELFKDRFIKATEIAREALDESDKEKSIETWQKLFTNFPDSVEQDEKTNAIQNAIKSGTAFVSSTGRVSAEKTTQHKIPVTQHRSFGD